MRRIILLTITFYIILILDTFFSALLPPLHLVEAVSIILMLIFLFYGFDAALIPAIIFGILYGASHMINIGLISVFYVLSLLITSSIRNRILTHKNYVSIFFLCVTFNMFFVLRVVAENLTFTLPLIQEMIFGILLNATLTFLVFVVINFFRHQMERRFLGTNVI